MCDCHCHDNYNLDTLVPMVGIVTDIRQETPDVKTFRVNAPEGGKLFDHRPGQCAMLCIPGISEGMFSITSVMKADLSSRRASSSDIPRWRM